LEEAVNLLQDRLCSKRLCLSLQSGPFTPGLPTRTLHTFLFSATCEL